MDATQQEREAREAFEAYIRDREQQSGRAEYLLYPLRDGYEDQITQTEFVAFLAGRASLPNSGELSDGQIDAVIEAVRRSIGGLAPASTNYWLHRGAAAEGIRAALSAKEPKR